MEDDLNKEKQGKLRNGYIIIFDKLFDYENADFKISNLFGLLYRLSRKHGCIG